MSDNWQADPEIQQAALAGFLENPVAVNYARAQSRTDRMSGRVISTPERVHRCAPGVTYKESVGEGLYALPKGTLLAHPPTPHDYPRGTLWRCDCGQTWVSQGSPALNQPGVCTFRREGRFERWRRTRQGSGVTRRTLP